MAITEIPSTGVQLIDADKLDGLLRGDEEIALLDVREEGDYGNGHILLAVPASLSYLETRIAQLVPRRSVQTVLYDSGRDDDRATRAAGRLNTLGYLDVSVLDGGLAAWIGAGKKVFTGANAISKAFGEFVLDEYHTPQIRPEELKAKIDNHEDIVILDSRPLTEFTNISIPGGIDAPGAEIIYRAFDQVKSPETLVVVNCAGRTRAIIGAQALINAGLPNQIVELENGTSGWVLAGLEAAHGHTEHAPDPSPAALAWAKEASKRIANRFGVRYIDAAQFRQFEAERNQRSLFVLDVRTPWEFEAGHLPGSVSAPGGQIVQALDNYVGVQRARIVLIDATDGVRGTATASWLIQIGLGEVYVYPGVGSDQELETGEVSEILGVPDNVDLVDAATALALVEQDGATVVDLARSGVFEEGHIPGAWFASRAQLPNEIEGIRGDGPIVLTSPDGLLAQFAAHEVAQLTERRVVALSGGTNAWVEAGRPLEAGLATKLEEPTDLYGVGVNVDLEKRRIWYESYVKWGREIVPQIDEDATIAFRYFPPSS